MPDGQVTPPKRKREENSNAHQSPGQAHKLHRIDEGVRAGSPAISQLRTTGKENRAPEQASLAFVRGGQPNRNQRSIGSSGINDWEVGECSRRSPSALLAALNAPPVSQRKPAGRTSTAEPDTSDGCSGDDEPELPNFELPLSHPAFRDTEDQDFSLPYPTPLPESDLTPAEARQGEVGASVHHFSDLQQPERTSDADGIAPSVPDLEPESEMPEYMGDFAETQPGDDPRDFLSLEGKLPRRGERSAAPVSEDQIQEPDSEMPEYMGDYPQTQHDDDPRPSQTAAQQQDLLPESEMPEYMEDVDTQEPVAQDDGTAGHDSEAEAELDAFLDDDELQPPSDDELDGPESPMQPPAAPQKRPEADSPQSTPSPLTRKGPAMHSWLIRTPEVVEPAHQNELHRDSRDTTHPVRETGEPAAPPGRQILPPQRFPENIDGLLMPITSSTGDLVYCNMTDNAPKIIKKSRQKPRGSANGLLGIPIALLMDDVEHDSIVKALAESTSRPFAPVLAEAVTSSQAVGKEELWVDKYSPKTFLDLLSDEVINKEVLKWLKSWDHSVFGPSRSPTRTLHRGQLRPVKGPPEQKILLMSGAPGLGKTTLAHIVARHCGYRPVEINASDDRTGAALSTRIVDATHMQPVIGAKLPNCVIIDEIDGAAGGAEGKSAIAALLKLINGSPGSGRTEPSDGSPATKTKKKKGVPPLNKPIIAICNDLYAPVLRPLRSAAKLVTFKAPQNNFLQATKLMARLQYIAAREKLAIDRQALMTLADKTDCDVRACLNTLQFLSKQHTRIRVADVARLSIGQKDMTKDVFSIWNELLCGKDLLRNKGKESHEKMYRMLGDFGDHELVLSGVHHNMLMRNYIDTGMAMTCKAFDQIHAADSYLTAIRRNMDFSLQAYLPATILSIRSVVASPDRARLQWPKPAMDAPRMLVSNQALLQGWLSTVSNTVYSSLRGCSLVQEIIPSLIRVLQQPIRAVAVNLFTRAEKRALASSVSTLLSYGISFDTSSTEASTDGGLALKPEIHTLCHFEGFPTVQAGVPLAVRQIITQAANEQRIRLRALKNGEEDLSIMPSATDLIGAKSSMAADVTSNSTQRPASAGAKLMYSVAERAVKAGTGSTAKKPARQSNWLEQIRESKQRRRPSALQQKTGQDAAGGADLPVPSADSLIQLFLRSA